MKYIQYGTEFLDQLKDKVHDYFDENKELKERINKAIEYIEKQRDTKTNRLDTRLERVSKILQGVDKE